MAEKEERKKLPPLQIGVSEFGNIRTVKMVRPICPVQELNDPLQLSCQREFNGRRGWWDVCEERGHNPYFREVVRKDETFVIPNTAQVALAQRINNGEGVQKARRNKGFRFLEEVGYDPVCEYRNCEAAVKVKSVYGNYCSERHARLIGADVEKVELEVHPDRRGEREKQLRQISIYDGNA